jgi:hypothetical protein
VISADVVTADGHTIHCDDRIGHNLGQVGRFRKFHTLRSRRSRIPACRPPRQFRTNEGASGNYSGPEVRFEEMRWTGTLLALRSPRTPFPDSGRTCGTAKLVASGQLPAILRRSRSEVSRESTRSSTISVSQGPGRFDVLYSNFCDAGTRLPCQRMST